MSKYFLGLGVLDWPRAERVTDRYGCVNLSASNGDRVSIRQDLIGKRGTLVVSVVETQKSYHIGDTFRGLYPETPEIGETITLGYGELFLGEYDSVGLMPEDGRSATWLDPNALYRCHNQKVALSFVEDQTGW